MQLGFFLPATLPLLSAAPSFVSESDRHLHHKDRYAIRFLC
ncbi:hypothetical protein HanOQP8_Chr04g0163921 [Helianthus annuus]|nr:hypothetical protein HanIR_Chr04g0200021 [Helianthus annuus]KAJ0762671.1 hypothetical protein HanOQP8_Chr04g0163921 [Helianthus annuus]